HVKTRRWTGRKKASRQNALRRPTERWRSELPERPEIEASTTGVEHRPVIVQRNRVKHADRLAIWQIRVEQVQHPEGQHRTAQSRVSPGVGIAVLQIPAVVGIDGPAQ